MGLLSKLRGDGRRGELPPPTYSNAAVVQRISQEEGVDAATARRWFGEMLIFLDLAAASSKPLSPPPEVDRAWHAFLLHTRDYEAYSRERFGEVVHHQPSAAPDPKAYRRAYEKRRAYGQGTPDPLWTLPVATAGDGDHHHGGAGCGSGSGDPDSGHSSAGDSSSGDSGGSSCSSSCGSSCGSSS